MWITNVYNPSFVSVVNTDTFNLVENITYDSYASLVPIYIAFDGINMWVGSEGQGNSSITIINAKTRKFVTNLQNEAYNNGINGIVFDGERMWVLGTGSESYGYNVSVIKV